MQPLLVGNPEVFAIESLISIAYDRLGFRALGYFVLHIGGRRYGVHKPDATLLACSYDAVQERVERRGTHVAPFAEHADGTHIARVVNAALYAEEPGDLSIMGLSIKEISDLAYANKLEWAPDGDEAFDDWSHVLQFDIGDEVRLIAYVPVDEIEHAAESLRDVRMSSDLFYGTLEDWRCRFDEQWLQADRVPEAEDGAEDF